MEISAGQDFFSLGENQRVVSCTSGFSFHHSARVLERVSHRAVHLRHAAQTVSVLYAWIVLQMRGANLTALKQLTKMICNLALSRMRTRCVDAFIKCNGSTS